LKAVVKSAVPLLPRKTLGMTTTKRSSKTLKEIEKIWYTATILKSGRRGLIPQACRQTTAS